MIAPVEEREGWLHTQGAAQTEDIGQGEREGDRQVTQKAIVLHKELVHVNQIDLNRFFPTVITPLKIQLISHTSIDEQG